MRPTATPEAPIELVVFDWDGTLYDSTAAIALAIIEAARDLELPVPSRERASHVIGLGMQAALAHAVPELTADRLPDFIARYRVHYFARAGRLIAFDGIVPMLDALAAHGVPLAIATGKSRIGLNQSLEQAGWSSRFVATRCADEGHPKPHPWMLLDLCETLGTDPARTVMIGDTTHDLAMARAAGAHGIGVAWGAHPVAELEREASLALLHSVADLERRLLELVGADSRARQR